ncbi:MAG TPA: aspartate--tRNA ligase [bacterium]|nr:aspartate--tRNA ligase [bacterium]HPL95836.1 aspartate--tRNA ligase [bacterium]
MNRTISIETIKKVGETVKLNGWVNNRRNMGKIVFLDVRDRWGIVQVVCVPSELDEVSQNALNEIRSEFVLEIEGVVQARGEKQINPNSSTGTVEVLAKKIVVLSKAETPPFEIDNENLQANEELRLKYRYLDLRHERMKNNMLARSKMMQFVRDYLHKKDFVEIHTPILSKSTPEGARDYLVPSRKFMGKFFALPQSPQQYKQMLMVSGMERYFQIAPCFRDEDARADRSPGEFYQIDMEMSFVTQNDILKLAEDMFTKMIKKLWPEKKMTFKKWPRLKHKEVMAKYGTDKPDLRNNKDDKDELAFAWVVDFPLFTEQTETDYFHGAGDKWAPSHHMFTAPKEKDIPMLDKNPGKVRSYQHDLVLNGLEVGGGSIRIHDANLQRKIFDLIGFTEKDKESFAHLLKAFEFGVPPHGGIAPGFDRLLSVLQGEKTIREIIAFPLLADAHDPLMDAPSEVSEKQLKELNIKINN